MSDEHWNQDFTKSLAVYLNGAGIHTPDEYGKKITDDHFLLLFNAHHEPLTFTLPPEKYGDGWRVVLNTAAVGDEIPEKVYTYSETIEADSRSVVVLVQPLKH
jgi:glycogen operon protein